MSGSTDEFVLMARPYDDPDVTRLVAEVQDEYVSMYGGPDAAAIDPLEFAPPAGLLLVGLLDGDPVATGGWRRVDGATAEIKRMFVRKPFRRLGLARLVLLELERTASGAGVTRMILNTGRPQQPAVALYRDAGYEPAAAFGHYADAPTALFFAKNLSVDAVN